jgi:transcriptional regulator with XRE-family HTH domain
MVVTAEWNNDCPDWQQLNTSYRRMPTSINLIKDEVGYAIPGVLKGSGGTATVSYSQSPSGSNVSFVISKGNSLAVAIETISATFGLTKEQLAEVIGSTRKSIYNWIDGSAAPRVAALNRIHELQLTANEWARSGLAKPTEQLNTPVLDGQSLFELLRNGANQNALLFAGTRLSLQYKPARSLADPFA